LTGRAHEPLSSYIERVEYVLLTNQAGFNSNERGLNSAELEFEFGSDLIGQVSSGTSSPASSFTALLLASHGKEKTAPLLTPNWMDYLHPTKKYQFSCVESHDHDLHENMLQVRFGVQPCR
jgi:hypothetical protein